MPRLTRTESRKITRERLVRSVEQGLNACGVSGMAVDKVARDAGYSRGAFYANFDDWADVLVDLLELRQERELQFWSDILKVGDDVGSSISHVIDLSRDIGAVMGIASVELQLEAERNEKFRPHYEAYIENIYRRICDLFVLILERYGKAPPDDLRAQVIAIYAVGLRLGLPSTGGMHPLDADQRAALILSLVMHVIAKAPPMIPGASSAPAKPADGCA
jgi:AcrR family transcriptional regulator